MILLSQTLIEELSVFLGILIVGFLFFGYLTRTRIFYLIASGLTMFVAFSYAEEMMLFLSLIGVSIFLFIFTFLSPLDEGGRL